MSTNLIALIVVSCVMIAGCNISNPINSHPKTWSKLLKTSPKELQFKQEQLKLAMSKLKNSN